MTTGVLKNFGLGLDRHLQLPDRFGLLDSNPGRWQTFQLKITALNAENTPKSSVKVFFLGRHGEGLRMPRSLTSHLCAIVHASALRQRCLGETRETGEHQGICDR